MQLELEVVRAGAGRATALASAPRVLALCFPDLPLQRVQRAREAPGRGERAPVAIERDGHVVACDPEARARGVRPGDAVVQARAACAALEIVADDVAADRAVLEATAEALLAVAPAVEIAWPDALLLDASGAHLFARGQGDGESALVHRATAIVGDLGLRCRTALAAGRAPARALARHGGTAAPVPPGGEPAALAPLPLATLELPPPLPARLAALGLRRIADLARLPAESLAHRFGEPGLAAWRVAQGDDPSPLVGYVPTRLPEERLELEAPLESAEPLLFALKRLCDRAAARLAGRGLGATRLALDLRLDPAGEERLEIGLAVPSSASGRWLLVLRERLGALRLPAAVTGAVLAVAEASAAPSEQLAIGDRAEQLVALETVLARLSARLGDGALFAAQPADRHRPEAAYGTAAFPPGPGCAARTVRSGRARAAPADARAAAKAADADADASAGAAGAETASPAEAELPRPTRLLPRPQPLVALGEGGRVTAVRIGGQTLRVLTLSPAERLAGEWWSEPFDRDYHRARVEGLGDCWIFRDAADGRLWLHGFFD